jgi:hypothetical protein
MWYYNDVKGRGNPKGSAKPAGEVLKKKVKNPLTNPLKCDTIRVQKDRGWEQTRKLWSATHQKKN